MAYSEQQAIEFINKSLIENGRKAYDEDQLINVIDMIWDYYEENGLLEIDADPVEDPENLEEELVDYVSRMLRKDKGATIDLTDVPLIVHAEIQYEDPLYDL